MAVNDEKVVEVIMRSEKDMFRLLTKAMMAVTKQSTHTTLKGIKVIQNTGQQRFTNLRKQNATLEHVDVNQEDLAAIKAELKRYKVDFAIEHNQETDKTHVFFKAQDRDIINLALENVLIKFNADKTIEQEQPTKDAAQEQNQEKNQDQEKNKNQEQKQVENQDQEKEKTPPTKEKTDADRTRETQQPKDQQVEKKKESLTKKLDKFQEEADKINKDRKKELSKNKTKTKGKER
ncbi:MULTISPECIES: DUF3801 domain-containing protein [Enterococcus]|uniref:DUF3801 domain-containing protein n=2 Tax=Enterococcus TaxID=1350 RepID=R2PSY4_9ENTE|nr:MULTISPECIES: DUF3801 domain-containing protein [Enterococcus]EOH86403.1 hypothetical protein UAU_05205 [Enterococcus pallens ATCC BAA-351]EOU09388.1 hypothetical protein I588_05234 [Enterococcus pallens ATCC BAA-351]MBO1340280.1 DUF3801 domain-containing protein [Enterococcus sp. 665A]OJG76428.1 hypothetical protein RV10_GL003756 [Enterococcus pallens]